jgi:hypothetical protein
MARIHFICRGGLNLKTTAFPEFESGFWDISAEDAARLVDGMIYLHESKPEPSYFGDTITAYRVEELAEAHAQRIVFTVVSQQEGRGVVWEGQDQVRAWTSGVIE